MKLRLQTHQVSQVLRVLIARKAAIIDCTDRVAQPCQLPRREEGVAFLQGAQQPHTQRFSVQGLENVIVGRELTGTHHALVIAFASDHDEHGVERDDALGVEVFQQMLAVLAVAQVVFAQHQIEALLAQATHGHRCRHRELGGFDPD